jgi:hypothetical protein
VVRPKRAGRVWGPSTYQSRRADRARRAKFWWTVVGVGVTLILIACALYLGSL